MRRRPPRPPLKSGLDTIGPFHPYLVYAGIVLLDLAGLVLLVAIVAGLTDWVEDLV